MPASRAAATQKNSLLIALIIFIVLFLVVAVFAVMFFMSNETLTKQKNTAQEELAEIASPRDLSMLKPLIARRGTANPVPAIKRIIADMNYMAALIAGEEMTTLPLVGIRTMMENETQVLWEQLALALPDHPAAADKSVGLIGAIQAILAENSALAERYEQLDFAMAIKDETHAEKMAALTREKDQINALLQAASRAAETNQADYAQLRAELQDDYELLLTASKNRANEIDADAKQTSDLNKALEKQLAACMTINKTYSKRLKRFQPGPETEFAALIPDGHVVSVSERDRVAYIDLAKDDHIYRGLIFSVYDSYQPIPKSGRGKASLEVIEIMDTISKCLIRRDDPSNPIMKKDIIASLTWSRDEKYTFCVAGRFDVDDDGAFDLDGRQQIVEMITAWGGQVAPDITVDTDFFVVGHSPYVPPRPSEEDRDNLTEAALAYDSAIQKYLAFQKIRTAAAELGVPTFPLSRFLYFVGRK